MLVQVPKTSRPDRGRVQIVGRLTRDPSHRFHRAPDLFPNTRNRGRNAWPLWHHDSRNATDDGRRDIWQRPDTPGTGPHLALSWPDLPGQWLGRIKETTSHCLLWSSGSGAGSGVTSTIFICRSTRSITRRIVSNGMPLSGSVTATFVGMSSPSSRASRASSLMSASAALTGSVPIGLLLGNPR